MKDDRERLLDIVEEDLPELKRQIAKILQS